MKAIVRFPKRREVDIPGHHKVQEVLRELNLNPETVIVIRGKTLLTRDTLVRDDETIEVLSAISGGV